MNVRFSSLTSAALQLIIQLTACLISLDKVWGQGQSINKLHRALWLSGSMKQSALLVLTSEVLMRL